jgi:hypothetical protein
MFCPINELSLGLTWKKITPLISQFPGLQEPPAHQGAPWAVPRCWESCGDGSSIHTAQVLFTLIPPLSLQVWTLAGTGWLLAAGSVDPCSCP